MTEKVNEEAKKVYCRAEVTVSGGVNKLDDSRWFNYMAKYTDDKEQVYVELGN